MASKLAVFPHISDEKLLKFSKQLLESCKTAEERIRKNPYGNVVDPFSAIVDSARQGISLDEWMEQEISRQIQKALQNHVGNFHQNIIGSIKGWHNPGKGGGYDSINKDKKIIVEIKNKHNTMNSSSAAATYQKLSGYLEYGERGYTAYVVVMVPKYSKRLDKPWTPSGKLYVLREDIRMIDGETFYELATGDSDALHSLYRALPEVLSKISSTREEELSNSKYFEKLFSRAYLD